MSSNGTSATSEAGRAKNGSIFDDISDLIAIGMKKLFIGDDEDEALSEKDADEELEEEDDDDIEGESIHQIVYYTKINPCLKKN